MGPHRIAKAYRAGNTILCWVCVGRAFEMGASRSVEEIDGDGETCDSCYSSIRYVVDPPLHPLERRDHVDSPTGG